MNQEDFNNAYILLLSGAAELKGKEVKWKDKDGDEVFIEFSNLTPTHTIVRQYWDNGKLGWECNWANGLKHGKELMWYENGRLCQKHEWVNGKLIK